MIESIIPFAEDSIEAATDPFPLVKEHLLRLCTSAVNEEWTASLRSQLRPLITLNPDPNCTQFSAAEVAVQIDILEQKVPEELKKLMKELTREQIAELLISDWLKEEMKLRIESTNAEGIDNESQSESLKNAVSDVKMIVEFIICEWKKNEGPWKVENDRIDDEEEEDDDEDDETEDDDSDCDQYYHDDWEKEKHQQNDSDREREKKEEEADNWADQQSNIILRLGQRNMDSSLYHPVYSTPEERLKKLEEDRRSKTDTLPSLIEVDTPAENQLFNVSDRIKKYIHREPEFVSEQQKRKHNFDFFMLTLKLQSCVEKRPVGWTHAKEIATHLRRIEESIPSDVQEQLHRLPPDQLSRVMILNWLDCLREENRVDPRGNETSQSNLRCDATLRAIAHFGSVAAMFPVELRNVANSIAKKDGDGIQLKDQRDLLEKELIQYFTYRKTGVFGKRMFPCPWLKDPLRPEEIMEWTKLIQSLDVMEEMKDIATQQELKNSSLNEEIAKHLHEYVHNIPRNRLLDLRPDSIFQYLLPRYVMEDWIKNISQEDKQTVNSEGSKLREYSPSTLAALLIGCAAGNLWTDVILRKFKRLNIKKSAMNCEEKGATMDIDGYSIVYRPWIETEAATIVEMGLKRFAPVFDESMRMKEGEDTPIEYQDNKE